MIGSRPSFISVPPMRFLIMDAPRQSNLHLYIKEMKKHSVSDVVRVCEPTYLSSELECWNGTSRDGIPRWSRPSRELIDRWLGLVEDTFFKESSAVNSKCLAVHCVAGLGRAPVMVAIALIEFANYDPMEAVALIRSHRRGAINEKQLTYLEGYKRHWKRSAGTGESACCVML
ncbi:protein tyrosine phosphatase [Fragilaria crotonensis]|nr:protein tyrosine phosphatase [Fragilaria crotonensis]